MVVATTKGLKDVTDAQSMLTQMQWAEAAGTADVITAAYPTPNTSLTDGMILGLRAAAPNTVAAPTFSPDGLTAAVITKRGGFPLQAGDIPAAEAEILLRFNQTNEEWELLNPGAEVIQWVVSAGTADAITATYPATVTALHDGLILSFRATLANLTATPTFAPDGLTARTIVKHGGQALGPGDIAGNYAEHLVRYNLVNTRWELLNPALSLSRWIAAAGTADAITATYAPAIPALVDGMVLEFRASLDNLTNAPTFSPNNLTAHPITKNGGATLVPGDIKAAGEYRVRYNLANTRWALMTHTPYGDEIFYFLAADDTGGTNVNTAQPWFPTTGSPTVKGGTTYEFEGTLYLSRAAGATSHTTSLLFGGTATLTNIGYKIEAMTGDANTLVSQSAVFAAAATAVVVKAASTSTTEQAVFNVRGVVRINAAGTFIPQFIYSAAPGGTPTIKNGSYFRMRPVGNGSVVTKGTWA